MVLYIAKRGQFDVGTKTHLQAVLDIYGEDNVLIVDLISGLPREGKNYVSYIRTANVGERIKRAVQGNTSYINNHMIDEICDLAEKNNVQLVFSEESDLGNLMKKLKQTNPGIRIICFYHDISADLFAKRKKLPGFGLYFKLIECNLTIRQERISQRYCDENWVFHVSDAEKFKKIYGYSPTVMIPLASPKPDIPDGVKEAVTNGRESKNILFVCSKYIVNRIGFKWFYENVLHSLKGNFEINVVGMGAKGLSDFCSDDRVNLIGTVEDLSEYYMNADIVIAPIFDGGGMKVKTMEAVSYAKNIVGTSESLHGFWERMPDTVQNRIVYRCDSAEEWRDALNTLIESDTHKYNEELNRIFEDYFSYPALLRQFKEHLPNLKKGK